MSCGEQTFHEVSRFRFAEEGERYIDGTLDRAGCGSNMWGAHVFDGLPLVNFGSQIGGNPAGANASNYPLNSNYFCVDDVAVTSSRSGCSVMPIFSEWPGPNSPEK